MENQSRHKTIEQKVREANVWKDVESELARMRKLATLKQGESPPDVQNESTSGSVRQNARSLSQNGGEDARLD
ncbi:MAG: hypothetical protein KME25_20510 [Symplocastrum torsivum CPER-KK1]|uniref:Uncharacterized protein n=1 Tax=Symplocastrum torsivum CPER-KK1 TaxID=450513 RepID=A0A951PND0_9CYAN|nr:hypothetical protein [Symplocastrum torsivum CPER-KK1]